MNKKVNKHSSELAIDIFVQTTKLLIALATSVLAFTVTFAKEINQNCVTWHVKIPWILLAISIIAGIFALQKIIGEVATKGGVSLYEKFIISVTVIQNLAFAGSVLWVAILMMLK